MADNELAPDRHQRMQPRLWRGRTANEPMRCDDETCNPKVAEGRAPQLGSVLRPPSLSRTGGLFSASRSPGFVTIDAVSDPVLETVPMRDEMPGMELRVLGRTVDRFPPATPADFACRPSVWRRWRGWLR